MLISIQISNYNIKITSYHLIYSNTSGIGWIKEENKIFISIKKLKKMIKANFFLCSN